MLNFIKSATNLQIWVSDPMVNLLSAMVWPLEKFGLYKFGEFYINRHIINAKLYKFQHIDLLTRGKYQSPKSAPKFR